MFLGNILIKYVSQAHFFTITETLYQTWIEHNKLMKRK